MAVASFDGVKLFLGTPTQHGLVSSVYANAVASLHYKFASAGMNVSIGNITGSCYVADARNQTVDQFLETDCTHLLFVDSDIGFNPDYVFHFLHFMEQMPECKIMGAQYPKKSIDWATVVKAIKTGMPAEMLPYVASEGTVSYLTDENGNVIPPKSKEEAERPFEVKELATGFMMIKREIFETYQRTYPERLFDKDRWMYFQCEVMAGQEKYIGDDFFFCRQMRAAGEKIWLCPWMDISHHGMHEFGAPSRKPIRV
jgi:hypothetical protein